MQKNVLPIELHDLYRLAGEAFRSPNTVKAAYAGRTSALSFAAVVAAAKRLGLPPPKPATE
jgi:hypothetical protein